MLVLESQVKRGLEIATFFITIAVALSACSEEERTRDERERPRPSTVEEEHRPAPGYEAVQVEDGGSIAGNVRWVGALPEMPLLPVRVHEELCGESQPSLALRVGPRRGVADAVVSLVDIRAGIAFAERAEPPTIAVQGCRFQPHVLGVGVGSVVAFRNDDPVLNNVHAMRGDETLWDFGLPERGSTEQRTVDAPGIVHVLSDVGSWMESWIHVFAHPYFAVTGEDGRFRILNVPPGQYVVRIWHEGWRVVGTRAGRPQYSRPVILTRTISVSERQETTLDFELSAQAAELAGE